MGDCHSRTLPTAQTKINTDFAEPPNRKRRYPEFPSALTRRPDGHGAGVAEGRLRAPAGRGALVRTAGSVPAPVHLAAPARRGEKGRARARRRRRRLATGRPLVEKAQGAGGGQAGGARRGARASSSRSSGPGQGGGPGHTGRAGRPDSPGFGRENSDPYTADLMQHYLDAYHGLKCKT